MRKRVLCFLSIALVIGLLYTNVVCTQAAERSEAGNAVSVVAPYYESENVCNCNFAISASGEACASVWYSAESNSFKQARLVVKLQKKVFGLLWRNIDIDESSTQWITYSDFANDLLCCYANLDDTGTYRAIISLEISTIYGDVDVIENTIECKYN